MSSLFRAMVASSFRSKASKSMYDSESGTNSLTRCGMILSLNLPFLRTGLFDERVIESSCWCWTVRAALLIADPTSLAEGIEVAESPPPVILELLGLAVLVDEEEVPLVALLAFGAAAEFEYVAVAGVEALVSFGFFALGVEAADVAVAVESLLLVLCCC